MADHLKDEKNQMKRELDSMDDFEHLGHDSSPLKEQNTADLLSGISDTAREIDKRAENVVRSVTDMFDPLSDVPAKMDSMGDRFKQTGDQFDKFLDDFKPTVSKVGLDKNELQSFVDREREFLHDLPRQAKDTIMDRYSHSEPDHDNVKPSDDDKLPKKELPVGYGNAKTDPFSDLDDFLQGPPKRDDEPQKPKTPELVFHSESDRQLENVIKPVTPESVRPKTPEPVRPKTPEPVHIPPEVVQVSEPIRTISEPEKVKPEPVKADLEPVKKQPEPIKIEPVKKIPTEIEEKPTIAPADTGAIFRKIGIDAWFNPERLNPKVESLIYWRDPKKSGPVFGGVLIVLLALTYFSLISVVAYLSLIGLTGTIAFRIYKNIVQAVQKTGDGHPFKDILSMDVSLPQDKVREVVDVAVAHFNASVVELRRLFLVEDLVDSIKFGVLLWVFTYLGAWFNGMTLIIIAWVALFSLPKVYETNKTQIDANLALVRSKLADITTKVKAAIPIGKKGEEKKEQ